MSARWWTVLVWAVVSTLALTAVLINCRAMPPSAVCGSDADCAAWEARQGIPEAARCYGAPCPAWRTR